MKAITGIILSAFYLLMSSGISFQLHYCMGELAGLGLPWQEATCSMNKAQKSCSMEKSSMMLCCTQDKLPGCCDEEIVDLGINIPGIIAEWTPLKIHFGFDEIVFSDFAVNQFISDTQNAFGHYRPPPLFRDIRISLHSLLFYH